MISGGLATIYVTFHGPIQDTEHIRLAHFSDPDGNAFYLSENK